MSFPSEFLDQLRARLSIADVVGRRVTFDRRKSNPRKREYWACCPFHGEKTPSFHVDDAKGFFHCFGCGVSGDVVSFVQQSENLSFPEAVERLAGEAGLRLPERSPQAEGRQDKRRALSEVLEAAQRFYAQCFAGRAGDAARQYLESRGCGSQLWIDFGLGYAPGRSALYDHLKTEGVPPALMAQAGLVLIEGERGPYDRFRERITFPIRDGADRLVGFGGRTLRRDPDTPKYLNSPETPLFEKGRLLFNYGPARRTLRETGTLIVVEGYMDVIALHGAGFANAVAPLGTALTAEQLALLWRVAPEPILCFDGDAAGQRAAARAADLALPLLKPGQSLRFALLPEGQDPDDVIRRQGPEALRALLAAPLPLAELLFSREIEAQALDTPERRADLEKRLLQAVRRIGDDSVRGHYERAARDKLRALFSPSVGFGGTAALPKDRSRAGRASPFGNRGGVITAALRRSALVQDARRMAARPKTRLAPGAGAAALPEIGEAGYFLADIEAVLLVLILDHPGLLERVAEVLCHLEPQTGKLDNIFRALIHLAARGERLDGAALRDHLSDCSVADAVGGMAARDVVRRMRAQWVERALGDVEQAWRALAERHAKIQRLRAEIDEAEAALGEGPGADAHWQRLKALMAERQVLERCSLWPDEGT